MGNIIWKLITVTMLTLLLFDVTLRILTFKVGFMECGKMVQKIDLLLSHSEEQKKKVDNIVSDFNNNDITKNLKAWRLNND